VAREVGNEKVNDVIHRAKRRIKSWRENPAQFVNEVFGAELDEWQKEAMQPLGGSWNPRRRLAMKACTGPGKSATLAWMGWHRLFCFAEKGEHPKGAALSGQGRDNLRDNLWAEMSKWQQRSEVLKSAFSWNHERIYANDYSETWFLSARSYPKDANAEAIGQALSGLHSRFPFILLDEIGDMPPQVGQKATQIFTGGVKDGLIAAAGNPTSTTGLLYKVCTAERELWFVVTITADPDDPRRTPRVDIEHAREQIALNGRDNPWIKATILGEFPPQGFNSLISVEDVEAAMKRHHREDVYMGVQKRIGVDVARFGDDRTVLFPRQGLAAFKPVEMRGARTDEIAARVMYAIRKWAEKGHSDIITMVDGTGGWGSGVIDSLIQAGQAPREVQFAGNATDTRYANKRAEMWFDMADWIKRGGALPNDPTLLKELCAPTYTFQKGKFLLEPKEQIKKRLGFSPDMADSLGLTFALPDMPATLSIPGINMRGTGHKSEYDPHAEERL
jgi:phage terminase large subunit